MKKENKILAKIIFEAINEILNEDDGGDYGGDSSLSGIGSGYGGAGGGFSTGGRAENFGLSEDFLLAMGITPLKDIIDTGLFAIKSISASAKHFLKQLVPIAIGVVVPFSEHYVQKSLDKMEEERIEQLTKLKNKYAAVLGRNMMAMHDHDMWGMFFLLAPDKMLATQAAFNVPGLVESLLELTGFGEPVRERGFKSNQGYFNFRISSRQGPMGFNTDGNYGSLESMPKNLYSSVERKGNRLLEEEDKVITKSKKEVMDAIKNNKDVKTTQEVLLSGFLDGFVKTLRGITTASYEQLDNMMNLSEITKQLDTHLAGKDLEQSKVAMSSLVKKKFIDQTKVMFVKELEKIAKEVPGAKQKVQGIIDKIQSTSKEAANKVN
jgi:hypothetical protein